MKSELDLILLCHFDSMSLTIAFVIFILFPVNYSLKCLHHQNGLTVSKDNLDMQTFRGQLNEIAGIETVDIHLCAVGMSTSNFGNDISIFFPSLFFDKRNPSPEKFMFITTVHHHGNTNYTFHSTIHYICATTDRCTQHFLIDAIEWFITLKYHHFLHNIAELLVAKNKIRGKCYKYQNESTK